MQNPEAEEIAGGASDQGVSEHVSGSPGREGRAAAVAVLENLFPVRPFSHQIDALEKGTDLQAIC